MQLITLLPLSVGALTAGEAANIGAQPAPKASVEAVLKRRFPALYISLEAFSGNRRSLGFSRRDAGAVVYINHPSIHATADDLSRIILNRVYGGRA